MAKALDTMTEGFRRDIHDVHLGELHEETEKKINDGLGFDDWETPEEILNRMREEYNKTQKMKDLFWKFYGNLWD